MNALLFLVTRRFINSFRRAFNNPGRTVGTLVVVGLFLFVYGGPLVMSKHQPTPPNVLLRVLPPVEIVSSILTLMVFGFLALSFFSAMNYTSAFTEHDVLNLFPTPLPRRLVFQFSLFTRGLLGSIFGAVVIAYFFFRVSRSYLDAMTGAGFSWGSIGAVIFIVLFIIANSAMIQIGVDCGLAVFNKRTLKIGLWSMILGVATVFLGTLLYCAAEYPQPGGSFWGSMLHQLHEPPCVWLFLPFRGIADCALVSVHSWTTSIPFAVILWAATFIIGHQFLVKRSSFLYEYAVHLAQGNTRRKETLKRHSFYSKTKIEPPHDTRTASFVGWRWLDEWTPSGSKALFWRNLLLMRRSGSLLTIKIYIGMTALLDACLFAMRTFRPGTGETELLSMAVAIQFILIFTFVPASIAWLATTLKRFEIQKPLPLKPRSAVLAELLTPTLAVALSNLFGMVSLIVFFPNRWQIFVLGYSAVGSAYMLVCCCLFIVLMFNPDQDDTLQRMLFGIYQLISLVIGFLPAGIVIAGGFILHISPVSQGAAVVVVNVACMSILIGLAAKKYESFNPVE
ncbi:MAG TPA: putative ABC exporter domain-containing protein [Bacteroidota bacterium]|nr:putative ABC exporter domain-containing protein [Bacteroidota bacterium]